MEPSATLDDLPIEAWFLIGTTAITLAVGCTSSANNRAYTDDPEDTNPQDESDEAQVTNSSTRQNNQNWGRTAASSVSSFFGKINPFATNMSNSHSKRSKKLQHDLKQVANESEQLLTAQEETNQQIQALVNSLMKNNDEGERRLAQLRPTPTGGE